VSDRLVTKGTLNCDKRHNKLYHNSYVNLGSALVKSTQNIQLRPFDVIINLMNRIRSKFGLIIKDAFYPGFYLLDQMGKDGNTSSLC